ncbi:hypothetical protein Dimus_012733 [Dionaea muscipula]
MNPHSYAPNSSRFLHIPSSSSSSHTLFNLHTPPSFSISIHHPNPNPNPSASYDEQSLRDEVIYLHSLWRRGPPSSRPTTSQNPNLKPNSIPFKKKKKKDPPSVSDKEWPVNPSPPAPSTSGSGWGDFNGWVAPIRRPATADEAASIIAARVQQKGLDSCVEFFESDDEEDDEEEDGGDGYADCVEFGFFCKLFEGDEELRGYYEKKYENGEFVCLVCGGIKQKLRKKYGNCISLAQHCITVSKTKKKRAHRAYGQVICKVLGWDINNLPRLVPPGGDAPSQPLLQATEPQDSSKFLDGNKLGALESSIVEETTTNNDNSLDNQKANIDIEGSASKIGGEMKGGEV